MIFNNFNCRMLIVLLLVFGTISCSDLPRDPKETLKRVEGGRLRVGLVEHPRGLAQRHRQIV